MDVFLTDSEDTVKAVIIVHNLLDCKGDLSHLLSEGKYAHLGIDRGVGVPAVVLRGMPVGRGVHICGGNSDKSRDKYQHHVGENFDFSGTRVRGFERSKFLENCVGG